MAEYYLGIDLGTTNSSCAVLRRGALEIICIEGEPMCPSVVSFQGRDDYVVGRTAKRRIMLDPNHTISSVKRKMGLLKFRYDQFGKAYNPEQISSFILKKIKTEAEKEVGPVRKAVITVPAYFNDDQRAATREAARLAGFEVLRLLSEPTAAAIAYGLNQEKDQTIAVYDLGGGTFDISILEVKGNTFTVKAVGGNHQLGGDDFDQALSKYVEENFKKSSGIDLKTEPESAELLAAMQKLKEECQKTKEELSDAENATVEIPNFYKGRHLNLPVSRKTFESLIEKYVQETVDHMKSTLAKARMTKDDIDRVILVGGSTHIPLVRQVVAKTIKEPYTGDNVMEMVARGAAIVAAQYMAVHEVGDEGIREIIQVSSLQELSDSLQEIYPYRLGIAVVDQVPSGESGRFSEPLWSSNGYSSVNGVFSEIVELGGQVPLQRKRGGFSTVGNNQPVVKIEIYRTSEMGGNGKESCREKGMRFLGDFLLKGIPPAPAGVPQISVSMDIDGDGILRVSAELEGSKKRKADSNPIHLWVDRELDRVEMDT